MLISCPKCVAVYDIDADDIPMDGRNFKCVECGNVWTVYPQDINDIEPENKIKTQIILPSEEEIAENDVQEMFERLSRDTNGLFSGMEKYTTKLSDDKLYTKQSERALDKKNGLLRVCLSKMQVFFSPFILNSCLLLLIAGLSTYIGYFNRYEIVRFIPAMENFYNNMNIESIYTGRDIVFDKLNVRPIMRGKKHFIELSGRLLNQGKYKAKLLPIKIEISDSNNQKIIKTVEPDTIYDLMPQMSSIFFLVLENKTADAKKINLSFIEK